MERKVLKEFDLPHLLTWEIPCFISFTDKASPGSGDPNMMGWHFYRPVWITMMSPIFTVGNNKVPFRAKLLGMVPTHVMHEKIQLVLEPDQDYLSIFFNFETVSFVEFVCVIRGIGGYHDSMSHISARSFTQRNPKLLASFMSAKEMPYYLHSYVPKNQAEFGFLLSPVDGKGPSVSPGSASHHQPRKLVVDIYGRMQHTKITQPLASAKIIPLVKMPKFDPGLFPTEYVNAMYVVAAFYNQNRAHASWDYEAKFEKHIFEHFGQPYYLNDLKKEILQIAEKTTVMQKEEKEEKEKKEEKDKDVLKKTKKKKHKKKRKKPAVTAVGAGVAVAVRG